MKQPDQIHAMPQVAVINIFVDFSQYFPIHNKINPRKKQHISRKHLSLILNELQVTYFILHHKQLLRE